MSTAPSERDYARGLRGWWDDPPRTGLRRIINPWEYRHLRAVGALRVTGGVVGVAAGLICLSYDAYWWALFFLVIGALNLAGGGWFLAIARSEVASKVPR